MENVFVRKKLKKSSFKSLEVLKFSKLNSILIFCLTICNVKSRYEKTWSLHDRKWVKYKQNVREEKFQLICLGFG